MKILITCAVWKRPEIFQIMTTGLQRMRGLMDSLGIETKVLFILDPTDEANIQHVHAMTETDWNILHTVISNDMPLGERMNRAMLEADGLDWDYMMQIGSDDLITDSGVLALCSYALAGCPFFGFVQIWFVCSVTRQMKQFRTSGTFGAGRMISRGLVEKTHCLWDPRQVSGLDNMMQANVYGACEVHPQIVNTHRAQVFDIKSAVNINAFNKQSRKLYPLDVSLCPELKYVLEL